MIVPANTSRMNPGSFRAFIESSQDRTIRSSIGDLDAGRWGRELGAMGWVGRVRSVELRAFDLFRAAVLCRGPSTARADAFAGANARKRRRLASVGMTDFWLHSTNEDRWSAGGRKSAPSRNNRVRRQG